VQVWVCCVGVGGTGVGIGIWLTFSNDVRTVMIGCLVKGNRDDLIGEMVQGNK
jgi:hypothetical protein